MEHHRSLAPSTLVAIYTIAVGLFGSAELRTFGAINLAATPLAVKAVNVASLFVILVVECIPKRRLLQKQYEVSYRVENTGLTLKDYPPSATTSILVKPFFPHLIPLLYTGSKRRLTLDDLTRLPPHVLARPARLKLEAALREIDDKSPAYLLKGTTKAFGRRLLSPVIPRLLLVLCTFGEWSRANYLQADRPGQVFLVQDITSLIANPSIPQERGWALVGGFVFIYTGMAFMTFLYGEKTFNISVEYRAALIGTLYEKSLKLTSTAAREVGQGAATTYFSVDAERVVSVMELIHEICEYA
jgi:ATP-binding cassette subfamily C (CFTR/MRP) protein 1